MQLVESCAGNYRLPELMRTIALSKAFYAVTPPPPEPKPTKSAKPAAAKPKTGDHA